MPYSPTISLSDKLQLSRIVHGYWRLAEWKLSPERLFTMVSTLLERGVTSFDHADIYGNHSCEKMFGDALKLSPSLREKMQLITKCGIKLKNGRFPERKVKIYDYSRDHILFSAEQSLRNFRTDRIDLLLLHRPAPFFDPAEVAAAFTKLREQGKVLNFGLSNFSAQQIEMLQSYCDIELLTNQVEVSPLCLDEFKNGNIEFYLRKRMVPMAWSPLAGGRLFRPAAENEKQVLTVMTQITDELGLDDLEKVAYAWLLKHPANFIPVVGSGRLERVLNAVDALDLDLSLEQWYRIFIAAQGEELP